MNAVADSREMAGHKRPAPASPCADVWLELVNAAMWRTFDRETTEMIVTPRGRCIFPEPEFRLSGTFDPECEYTVELAAEPLSDIRYRWDCVSGMWTEAGRLHVRCPPSRVTHEQWFLSTRDKDPTFKFNKTKLTNVEHAKGKLSVNTMGLYCFTAYVRWRAIDGSRSGRSAPFRFSETKFMAVTVYHNPAMRTLKKENNPHATWIHTAPKRSRKLPKLRAGAVSRSPPRTRRAHSPAKAEPAVAVPAPEPATAPEPALAPATALARDKTVAPEPMLLKIEPEQAWQAHPSYFESLPLSDQDDTGDFLDSTVPILLPDIPTVPCVLDEEPYHLDDIFLPWEPYQSVAL